MVAHRSHGGSHDAPARVLVVIVDESAQRAERAAAIVRELGADAVISTDVEAFDRETATRRPDLVIAAAGAAGDAALARHDAPPVVLLHGDADIPTVVDAMRRGAIDYLADPVDTNELRDRLRSALAAARRRRDADERRASASARVSHLNRRMRLLAEQIMLGRSSADIARRWGVSERTVAGHRASLMRAMGAQNTAQLVRTLIEGGFAPGGRAPDRQRSVT